MRSRYRLCRSKASQNFSNAENVSLIARRREISMKNSSGVSISKIQLEIQWLSRNRRSARLRVRIEQSAVHRCYQR